MKRDDENFTASTDYQTCVLPNEHSKINALLSIGKFNFQVKLIYNDRKFDSSRPIISTIILRFTACECIYIDT